MLFPGRGVQEFRQYACESIGRGNWRVILKIPVTTATSGVSDRHQYQDREEHCGAKEYDAGHQLNDGISGGDVEGRSQACSTPASGS